MSNHDRETPVLTPTEARQSKRVGLIWVLAVSGIGAVIALAIIYFNFAAT